MTDDERLLKRTLEQYANKARRELECFIVWGESMMLEDESRPVDLEDYRVLTWRLRELQSRLAVELSHNQ